MQPRLHSLIEQVASVGVGFFISLLTWEFIVKPVWEIDTNFAENLQITLLFTVISIARGYAFRRVANCITVRQQQKQRDGHAETDRNRGEGPRR